MKKCEADMKGQYSNEEQRMKKVGSGKEEWSLVGGGLPGLAQRGWRSWVFENAGANPDEGAAALDRVDADD